MDHWGMDVPSVTQHQRRATRSVVAILTAVFAMVFAASASAQEQPPNVIGFSVEDAQAVLEEAGFASELVPPDPPIARELVVVIDQEDFPEDEFVRLFIGTEVPDVTGFPGSDVEGELAQYGLAVSADGELAEGWFVFEQSPEPGALVGFGETVLVGLELVEDGGGEDGDGDGSPWPWVVLILVLGGGAIVTRRWRRLPAPTEEQPENGEPDEKLPQRVSVRTVPGSPSIDVDLPPDSSPGHSVRVELVVGAATHHVEESKG